MLGAAIVALFKEVSSEEEDNFQKADKFFWEGQKASIFKYEPYELAERSCEVSIDSVCIDVLASISLNLDIADIIAFSQTNRRFQFLLFQVSFWKQVASQFDYSLVIDENETELTQARSAVTQIVKGIKETQKQSGEIFDLRKDFQSILKLNGNPLNFNAALIKPLFPNLQTFEY